MSGFPVVIRSSSKMFNKASQSDLRKLSSFLQKDVKASNSLRQLLAALCLKR